MAQTHQALRQFLATRLRKEIMRREDARLVPMTKVDMERFLRAVLDNALESMY